MDSGKPKPQPKATPKKEQPKDQTADDLDEKAGVVEEVEPIKPDADKKPEDTKPEDKKYEKASELRNAYNNLKAKEKQEYLPLVKKAAELEARVKEYETKNPEAEKATKERIAAIEKRNEELENAIRFASYQDSKEYKELQAKVSQTWGAAEHNLAGIKITSKNADGEPVERDLTMDDIAGYARMDPKNRTPQLKIDVPDPAERTMVINHISEIIKAHQASEAAEKKAKEEAQTHSKTQQEQQAEFQKNMEKSWRESNENYSKQYPQWFAKVEGDKEGNTLFDKGTALADLIFFPNDMTDERIAMLPKSVQEQIAAKKPFTVQQVAKLKSIVRNKAANHDRLAFQNKALTKRVAELEKSLKEYEDSGPDNVRAGTVNGGPKGDTDWKDELDALDKKGGR